MCGRVVTSSTPEELAEYLGADEIVATAGTSFLSNGMSVTLWEG